MEENGKQTNGWQEALTLVGSGSMAAGRYVARKCAAAYQAVDPDVRRHLYQIPLLTYSLIHGREPPLEPGEPDGHPPLVFVHGLGGSRGDFSLMAWSLGRAGRTRSYRIAFYTGQTIAQRAEQLARYVRQVLQVTGEQQVDMVAHSMGGIVARLAILDHAIGDSIRTFITLGTPHKGTHCARFTNTDVTRELRPDSNLVQRLSRHPLPPNIQGVSCWSQADVIVIPGEAAALDGTVQLDLTPFTHYGYLIRPKAWKVVRGQLHAHRDQQSTGVPR